MGRGNGPDYHAPPLKWDWEGGRKQAQAKMLHDNTENCEQMLHGL